MNELKDMITKLYNYALLINKDSDAGTKRNLDQYCLLVLDRVDELTADETLIDTVSTKFKIDDVFDSSDIKSFVKESFAIDEVYTTRDLETWANENNYHHEKEY